jgi:uncharacterized protein (DUF1684 family)
MKAFFINLFVFFYFGILFSQSNYEQKIRQYQKNQTETFLNKKTSPLADKDLENFRALPYFPINQNYRVIAYFKRTPLAPYFVIKTTTRRKPLYQKYGIATFFLNGTKLELSIYQSYTDKYNLVDNQSLFLPFKDRSNGEESYEGGRYLNVYISDILKGRIVLDFNKSYNPYCAYNYEYSCPLPPIENHLDIAVLAGIKKGLLKRDRYSLKN